MRHTDVTDRVHDFTGRRTCYVKSSRGGDSGPTDSPVRETEHIEKNLHALSPPAPITGIQLKLRSSRYCIFWNVICVHATKRFAGAKMKKGARSKLARFMQ